jgi:large subunit ribosomal protein L18
MSNINKKIQKLRRKGRIRAKISGTENCLRLSVFRSNTAMYLQLIDDAAGKTLVSANMKDLPAEILRKGTKTEQSFEMGKIIGKKAIDKKISAVVFDRGGNRYHGRVKAAADGAREAGLIF